MVQVLRANSSATSLVRLRLRPRPRLRLGVGVGVGLPAGRWLPGVRLPGACTLPSPSPSAAAGEKWLALLPKKWNKQQLYLWRYDVREFSAAAAPRDKRVRHGLR